MESVFVLFVLCNSSKTVPQNQGAKDGKQLMGDELLQIINKAFVFDFTGR